MSHVLCHVSFLSSFFGHSGGASRWRVCYQRGTPSSFYCHREKTQDFDEFTDTVFFPLSEVSDEVVSLKLGRQDLCNFILKDSTVTVTKC